MEIKHLNTFLVLSRLKNFTKTAEYLGYAQSSITTQIQKLEDELQVHLFERIGKSVSLTLEGEHLIPYARQLVSLSVDIGNMYESSQADGPLRIGASESIGIYRLPAILREYKCTHPDVDLYLSITDSSEIISLLTNCTIDVAFILDQHISDPSIITAMEIEEPLWVFASPDHPLTDKKKVEIHDFANRPFILTGYGCCYRKIFERELAAHFISPQIVLETSSIQVIKESAKNGFTQLVYHKDKWLSPNMKDFIQMTKQLSLKTISGDSKSML